MTNATYFTYSAFPSLFVSTGRIPVSHPHLMFTGGPYPCPLPKIQINIFSPPFFSNSSKGCDLITVISRGILEITTSSGARARKKVPPCRYGVKRRFGNQDEFPVERDHFWLPKLTKHSPIYEGFKLKFSISVHEETNFYFEFRGFPEWAKWDLFAGTFTDL